MKLLLCTLGCAEDILQFHFSNFSTASKKPLPKLPDPEVPLLITCCWDINGVVVDTVHITGGGQNTFADIYSVASFFSRLLPLISPVIMHFLLTNAPVVWAPRILYLCCLVYYLGHVTWLLGLFYSWKGNPFLWGVNICFVSSATCLLWWKCEAKKNRLRIYSCCVCEHTLLYRRKCHKSVISLLTK